jgi:hypothetical protein
LRLDRLNYPGQSAITSDRWGTRIGKNFHKPTIGGAPTQRKLLARNRESIVRSGSRGLDGQFFARAGPQS